MRCVSQWSLKQENAWTGWIVELTLSLREKTYFVLIVCMLNERIDESWDTGRPTFTKRRAKKKF